MASNSLKTNGFYILIYVFHMISMVLIMLFNSTTSV